jgi:coenzyme F420-reducing hydrogenase delta subunit
MPGGARMNARDAYLIALIRARRSGSVDGALRSAEAFQELGDRVIVEQCLYIAAQLAAGDDRAQQRVREVRERWAAPSTIAGS